jgi:hypothetical protein
MSRSVIGRLEENLDRAATIDARLAESPRLAAPMRR